MPDRRKDSGCEPTATLVAEKPWLLSTAKIYRLSERIPWFDLGKPGGFTDHVVVSAVMGAFDRDGPEAMAWACDADGEFLAAGGRGDSVACAREYRHDAAVEALGFRVAPPLEPVRQLPRSADSVDEGEPATREEWGEFDREMAKWRQETIAKLLEMREAFEAEIRAIHGGEL